MYLYLSLFEKDFLSRNEPDLNIDILNLTSNLK